MCLFHCFGGMCEHITFHDVEVQKNHFSNRRCGKLPTYTTFRSLIYLCTFSFLTLSFPVLCSTDLKNFVAAAVGLLSPLPEFVFILAKVSAVSFQLWRETFSSNICIFHSKLQKNHTISHTFVLMQVHLKIIWQYMIHLHQQTMSMYTSQQNEHTQHYN